MPDEFKWDMFLSLSLKDRIEEGREHSRAVALTQWMEKESGVSVANAVGSDRTELAANTCWKGNLLSRDQLNKKHRFIPLRLEQVGTKRF